MGRKIRVFGTYGKKNKKPSIKKPKEIKPNNIQIVNINLKVNHINVTNITNIHFGNSTSSGDEFDKLLKGPSYQPFHNVSKKTFFQRQDSEIFYNSNATGTTLSSSSSVGLYKDPSDIYSQFDSPHYKGTGKKFKKSGFKKTIKKKQQRLSVSWEYKFLAKATSSTPTHPNSREPRDQWPGHVSPIMPLSSRSPPAYFRSRSSTTDMFEENKVTEVESAKVKSNMSELAAEMLKLGMNTPDIKDKTSTRKALNLVTPSEVNIQNNQPCYSTRSRNKHVQSFECVQNISETQTSVLSRSVMDEDELFKNPDYNKFINDNSCDQISDKQDKSLVNVLESSKVTLHQNKSGSWRQDRVPNKAFEFNESCQSKFNLSESKSEESENIPHCIKASSKRNSESLKDRNNENPEPNEPLHQLSSWGDLVSCSEQQENTTKCIKSNDAANKAELSLTLPVNLSTAETALSNIGSNKQNPPFQAQKLTYCRMSLKPGKMWRRSFLEQKRTGTGTSRETVGPEILAKLAQEANLSSTRLSLVNDSKSFFTVNESFLKRVSIRPNKYARKPNEYHEDYNEISNVHCEEFLSNQSEKSKMGFDIDTAPLPHSVKAEFERSVEFGKVTNRHTLKNFTTLKGLNKQMSMENILEESVEEISEVSETKSQTNSPLPELEDKHTEGSSTQQSLHQESMFETPPIMKVNPAILMSTITKRKLTQKRKEIVNISVDSEKFNSPVLNRDTVGEQSALVQSPDDVASYTNETPDRSANLFNEGSESCKSSSLYSPSKQSGFLTSTDEEDLESSREDDQEDFTLFTCKEGFLLRCGVESPSPFSDVFTEESLKNCKKIGEGVYGEVFMFHHKKEKSVVKIIPIEGHMTINGAPQKKFDEVLSELITTEALSLLREDKENKTAGFCLLKRKLYLKGSYPPKMLDLWHAYNNKYNSYNECPDKLGGNNCFLALELEHAGEPVESFVFNSAKQTYSVFLQVCYSLAAAEMALSFEHRDLHIGNILVKKTKDTHIHFTINNEKIKLPSFGLKATIIDFTLSRISFKGGTLYFDLSKDPELFTSDGDIQFDIYRFMRTDLDDNWETYQPKTNLRWLQYLLEKMLTKTKYRNATTKVHKEYMKRLERFKVFIQDFDSAFGLAEFLYSSFVETSSFLVN